MNTPVPENFPFEAQEPISLAALEEGVRLPPDASPAKRRRKILLTALALLLLVAATGAGGYYLLRGQRVNLKATPRLPVEQAASGKDIQQAAFASLHDALNQSSPAVPSPAVPSPAVTPEAAPPPETPPGEERVAAPLHPGIAATLAPPPEAVAPEDSLRRVATPSPTPASNAAPAPPGARAPATTQQSIRVAPQALSPLSAHDLRLPPMTAITPARSEPAPPPRPSGGAPAAGQEGPAFGTMLPVRLLGVLYTLRPGALARLELTRDLQTGNQTLRRGTMLIGHVQGSGLERAYLQIQGYLDPDTRAYIRLEGEVLGNDGGAGLRGKERRVSPVWVRVLNRAAQAAVQLGTGLLNRGSASVIVAADPYGTYRDSTGTAGGRGETNRSFVEVPAGTTGFVLVTTLPKTASESVPLTQAPVASPVPSVAPQSVAASGPPSATLSDEELAALLTDADPVRLRAALPRMSPDLQRVALLVLRELEKR